MQTFILYTFFERAKVANRVENIVLLQPIQ